MEIQHIFRAILPYSHSSMIKYTNTMFTSYTRMGS